MLKPYRQRVLGTYVLLEAALKLAAQDAMPIAQAKAADRAVRPETLLTRWKPAAEPIGWIDTFKGVAFETYVSPVTGRAEQKWLGRPVTWRMPIIGQDPVETVTLPKAWWIPASQTDVIDRLTVHGIRFEVLAEPRTLTLDRVRLHDPHVLPVRDARMPLDAKFQHGATTQTLPAGMIRVPSDQPLGLLAAALLEPESQDSFLAWGFFPEILATPPGAEDFVRAPLAEAALANDPKLQTAFEQKLAAEPAFAADPDARLNWLFDQLPGRSPYYLTYPILREP
jgi:hypothetical protein